jgi:hypothetical protein
MMPKRKFWLTGCFEDVSEQEMPRIFDSNLFGAMALTRAVQVEPFGRNRHVAERRARFLLILRRYLSGKLFDNVWSREMTKRVTGTQG